MKWKKLKSQYILWPYKELTDEFCPFQRHSVRGNWIFLLGVGTPIIIIFIISSMNTHGAVALHQYSCLMCWCPAIIKCKATAPPSKDVVMQVTLVSRCPLEVSAVQTKGRMGSGRKDMSDAA